MSSPSSMAPGELLPSCCCCAMTLWPTLKHAQHGTSHSCFETLVPTTLVYLCRLLCEVHEDFQLNVTLAAHGYWVHLKAECSIVVLFHLQSADSLEIVFQSHVAKSAGKASDYVCTVDGSPKDGA